jgi:hypothetical protein
MPAAIVNGEAGELVTSAGNPESVIVTGALNPFCPRIDTAKFELEPPVPTVMAEGNNATEKS